MEEEKILLVWLCIRYNQIKGSDFETMVTSFVTKIEEDWVYISQMFPGKSAQNLKLKFLSLKKCNLQNLPWSKEEDTTMTEIVK